MAYWKQEETQGTLMDHGRYILSFCTDVYRPLNTTNSWLTPGYGYGYCDFSSSTSGRVYSHQDRIRAINLARKGIAMNAGSVRHCGKINGNSKTPQSFIRIKPMF
jgi:hypothetical protein